MTTKQRVTFQDEVKVKLVSKWIDPAIHQYSKFESRSEKDDMMMEGTEEWEIMEQEVNEYLEVLGSMINEGMVTNFHG